MINRICHYFESVDELLAARSAEMPVEPVTLYISRDVLVDLLATNIMAIIQNRPPFFPSEEDQEEYQAIEADRRAFLAWVRQSGEEQLVVAVLPCVPGANEGEEG